MAEIIHASTVSWQGSAVIIMGASGSGKSSLALTLLAYGCDLVADDRTLVSGTANGILASCPESLQGLVEARGVGLLRAEPVGPVPVNCLIDMDRVETDRLPRPHTRQLLTHEITCFHKSEQTSFPAAILQYLKMRRV